MARIARCGVAFPYAWVVNDIFGETPVQKLLDLWRRYATNSALILISRYPYHSLLGQGKPGPLGQVKFQ